MNEKQPQPHGIATDGEDDEDGDDDDDDDDDDDGDEEEDDDHGDDEQNLLNVKCAICSFNIRLASCVADVCVTNVTSLIINMSFNLTVNGARADDSNSNNNNNNMIQHTSCIANLCVTNVTICDNQLI